MEWSWRDAPDQLMVKAATGEVVSAEDLGDGDVHTWPIRLSR